MNTAIKVLIAIGVGAFVYACIKQDQQAQDIYQKELNSKK